MSEGNHGMKEDESDEPLSDSDDYPNEIIDIEIGSQEPDPNEISEQAFFAYVSGGIDVQTSDVLMVEHLADEMQELGKKSHDRSSDEILTSPSQINLDEENDGQLAYSYFDNSDLCKEKGIQKLEACSFQQDSKNNENSLNASNNKPGYLEDTINARHKIKEMSQENISSGEKQTQKSQIIENPCTQIFKFMRPKLEKQCEKSFLENNKSDLLKCPDYESDEFADVEDNAKDSSDNYESSSELILVEQQVIFIPEGRDIDEQLNEPLEKTTTVFTTRSETDLSKDNNMSSVSRNSQSYNFGASCSHTSNHDAKHIPDSSGPIKSEENNVKFKMATVADVADTNDGTSPKDGKSSRHKANTLKMKTKVGMRKDKCNVCRARLGLCAIKCRCGGYYCAKHRYDKEHNCTFDYKSMGAEEIRKNNPRVVAEKIRRF